MQQDIDFLPPWQPVGFLMVSKGLAIAEHHKAGRHAAADHLGLTKLMTRAQTCL